MSKEKKKPIAEKPAEKAASSSAPGSTPAVNVTGASGWNKNEKKIRRVFPGPANASSKLRIAIERNAYAGITAHAHDSLTAEVCGVLVGGFCEDDDGAFVHIQHIITGTSASQGSAHVTFTHQTWNDIHAEMDRKYPGLSIVGWYHSHPGFGVIFSDMDLFIQKNFFSLPTQCALVMDPLGGDTAVCVNGIDGPEYIDRIWVDGREKKLFLPLGSASSASGPSPDVADFFREGMGSLENRLNQVVQVLDKQQRGNHRVILALLFVAGLIFVFCVGYTVYKNLESQNKPPEITQYIPIPIRIGNDTALIGIGIVDWKIPPKTLAYQNELMEERLLRFESLIRDSLSRESGMVREEPKNWFSRFLFFCRHPFQRSGANGKGSME